MATIHPRRKVITYGRSSRKTTSCLDPAAADAFSRIAFTEEVRSIDDLGLTPDLTTCALKTTPRLRHRVQSPEMDSPIGNIFTPNLNPRRQGRGSLSERKDTIDDIPTSDEQGRQRSRIRRLAGRKRRKIIINEGPNENAAVSHGGIQGTWLAPRTDSCEVLGSHPPRTSLKVSSSREQTPQGVIGGNDSRKSTENVQGRSENPTLPQRRAAMSSKMPSNPAITDSAKLIRAVSRTAANAGVADQVDPGRVPSDVATTLYKEAGPMEWSRSLSPTTSMSPSGLGLGPEIGENLDASGMAPATPLRRSRPSNGITTPHQRGLWSMILPGTKLIDSPGALDLPGLNIDDKRSKARSCDQRSAATYEALDKLDRGTRRRRLIDSLQNRSAGPATKKMHNDDETSTDKSEREDEEAVDMSQDLSTGSTPNSHEFPINSASQLLCMQISTSEFHSKSQLVQLNQGLGAKATYARQRSYLTEGDINDISAFDLPTLEDAAAMRRSRRRATKDVHARLPHAESGVVSLDEALDSQGPALRSIHELRKAGGNSRLVSEIEAMMEDVCEEGSSSLSLRRSRLLELTGRLQEPSFRQVFIDHGFDCRLLARANNSKDVVENLFLSAAILQLLSGPVSTPLLNRISSPSVIRYLIGLLEIGQEITSASSARMFNMSKNAHLELNAFCQDFIVSSVWSTVKPTTLTPRALALQCLERLVRQTREVGCVNDILPPHDICRIAQFLEEPLYGTTLPSLNAPTVEFQLAISILESCTIANKDSVHDEIWSGRTLNAVLGLLPMLTARFTDSSETLRSLALRLYLNLTNNNPELCEAFSRPDVLQSICDTVIVQFGKVVKNTTSQALELDSLILSLGSLINLAEWCEAVRNSTLELPNEDSSYLDQFVEILTANSNKTAEVCCGLP